MITAPTLDSVVDLIQPSFFKQRVALPSPDMDMTFCRPGDMLKASRSSPEFVTIALTQKIKLVGLVFMHPESEVAKKEILPRIDQFHWRAGEYTDLFFAGYGAYWSEFEYPDKRVVTKVDNIPWLFSERAFTAFLSDLEKKTLWTYSGETDLILTTARYCATQKRAVLDFNECVTIQLEGFIKEDKGALSVASLFEKIFQHGKASKNPNVYDFSDLHLVATSKNSFIQTILYRLGLKDYFNKNKQMAIRDISRR